MDFQRFEDKYLSAKECVSMNTGGISWDISLEVWSHGYLWMMFSRIFAGLASIYIYIDIDTYIYISLFIYLFIHLFYLFAWDVVLDVLKFQ